MADVITVFTVGDKMWIRYHAWQQIEGNVTTSLLRACISMYMHIWVRYRVLAEEVSQVPQQLSVI
jgi:hypothetical protein